MLFMAKYASHNIKARQLLLNKELVTIYELAIMSDRDVEDKINKHFTCYWSDPDWLCVEKTRMTDFNEIINWIDR